MRSRFLALVLVLAGPALPSSAVPAGAVRSVLARAIAAAPTYFASLIDRRRRHVMGDGYIEYAATPAMRAACGTCTITIDRTLSSGNRIAWIFTLALPDGHGRVSVELSALRALVTPLVPASFHFSGRAIECDGGSQSLRWAGPGGSEIEAYASLDAQAGGNAISRSVVITVTP